jgi:hypothetical protein
MNEVWRRTRVLVAFLVGYALLYTLLLLVPADHGLLTPEGHLHLSTALLTSAVLIVRLIAWFLVVPLLVYRVVRFC